MAIYNDVIQMWIVIIIVFKYYNNNKIITPAILSSYNTIHIINTIMDVVFFLIPIIRIFQHNNKHIIITAITLNYKIEKTV